MEIKFRDLDSTTISHHHQPAHFGNPVGCGYHIMCNSNLAILVAVGQYAEMVARPPENPTSKRSSAAVAIVALFSEARWLAHRQRFIGEHQQMET